MSNESFDAARYRGIIPNRWPRLMAEDLIRIARGADIEDVAGMIDRAVERELAALREEVAMIRDEDMDFRVSYNAGYGDGLGDALEIIDERLAAIRTEAQDGA